MLIHYPPGARGDFLASILLNSFNEKKFGGVMSNAQPNKYLKLHSFYDETKIKSFTDIENFDGIKIRIDPGLNARSLIEIRANETIKNDKIPDFTIKEYDIMYISSLIFINNEYSELQKHKNIYDYWIDYNQINNEEFLKELYSKINKKTIDQDLLEKVRQNIKKQRQFNQDNKMNNLIKLLDFEIKNDLLNKVKYFNMFENIDNIDDFLNINNYQKD